MHIKFTARKRLVKRRRATRDRKDRKEGEKERKIYDSKVSFTTF